MGINLNNKLVQTVTPLTPTPPTDRGTQRGAGGGSANGARRTSKVPRKTRADKGVPQGPRGSAVDLAGRLGYVGLLRFRHGVQRESSRRVVDAMTLAGGPSSRPWAAAASPSVDPHTMGGRRHVRRRDGGADAPDPAARRGRDGTDETHGMRGEPLWQRA